MPAEVRCGCGALLRAPAGFETGRAICPVCQSAVLFGAPPPSPKPPPVPPVAAAQARPPIDPKDIPLPVVEFLDPPTSQQPQVPAPPATPWAQRMLAALLDPRSIQWMMM